MTRAELGRSLDVHHIIPFRRFAGDWRAANDLANLLTLCPTCHAKADAVARAEEKSCPRSE